MVIGGLLRFANLSRAEMSADEGASWAAARAPSLIQVIELQPTLNPGKFAVHELALHGWIKLFGDQLAAMRALSAFAGTLAIAVVFFMARELFGTDQAIHCPAELRNQRDERRSSSIAAVAAMLFAVNLVFVKYAQEARMYSVALLGALIQVGFFCRSLRRTAAVDFVLTALFTAFAIGTTFTICLILPPETLWLAYLRRYKCIALRRRAALAGLALLSGIVLLIGPTIIYLHAREHEPALVSYAWASTPPFWAPLSMFNKATGSLGFPVALALVFWGLVQTWSRERDAIVFVLLWMLLPPILVLAASYLIRPAFVERYMLASFVPFFLLVAVGLCRTTGVLTRYALLALVTVVALAHIYSYWRNPHDVQWREASQIALATNGRTIFVAPPYAADVVRYYLRDSHRNRLVETSPNGRAAVAIVADTGVSAREAALISSAFPRLLITLRGVIVRVH
jgi:4-amino-4-deoxy-L-arabinose transferase-like glycosyltransferase